LPLNRKVVVLGEEVICLLFYLVVEVEVEVFLEVVEAEVLGEAPVAIDNVF